MSITRGIDHHRFLRDLYAGCRPNMTKICIGYLHGNLRNGVFGARSQHKRNNQDDTERKFHRSVLSKPTGTCEGLTGGA